jgi:hypothetical protein
MIGALIGDLAAWTWEHDHSKFYPQLFSDVAQKSDYSDVMLQTAKLLLQYPNISRDEFMRIHRCYFGLNNAKANAEYDLLRSIIIGWMYDGDEISNAIHRYCICDDKEELYASHFMANLIYRLRTGYTKKEAAQIEFCGTFRSFTKEEHWKTGDGVLSYLVRAWMSFYDAFDFGSSIHNATKKPGNQTLNCILAGALADAMYGCENYFVKKKFEGGRYIEHLDFVDNAMYKLIGSKRTFFPKNNARTNIERHYWYDAPCPFSDKVITPELKRRITKAFYTGWEDRFGFYFDDGWYYVYRSFILLSRFKLKEFPNGTYRIVNYQKSDEAKQYDLDDTAISCAMYSVEHHWDIVSNE